MAGPIDQGLVDFGERLRRIRKLRRLSQQRLAEKIGCSDSSLSRYERGELLMPEEIAEALDRVFDGQEHLLAERNALAAGSWVPQGAFRTAWTYNHPAAYAGPVWMRVVPDPYFAGSRHRIEVRWRNWKLCREAVLDENGGWFTHTKGDDGLSVPIEVRVEPACQIAFGRGDPPGTPVFDINHGWGFWLVYDIAGAARHAAEAMPKAREMLLNRAAPVVQRKSRRGSTSSG